MISVDNVCCLSCVCDRILLGLNPMLLLCSSTPQVEHGHGRHLRLQFQIHLYSQPSLES